MYGHYSGSSTPRSLGIMAKQAPRYQPILLIGRETRVSTGVVYRRANDASVSVPIRSPWLCELRRRLDLIACTRWHGANAQVSSPGRAWAEPGVSKSAFRSPKGLENGGSECLESRRSKGGAILLVCAAFRSVRGGVLWAAIFQRNGDLTITTPAPSPWPSRRSRL